MANPHDVELYRHLHDDRVSSLRTSMRRRPGRTPRRALGSWLVSIGLHLAPDEALHRRLAACSEQTEPPVDAAAPYSIAA